MRKITKRIRRELNTPVEDILKYDGVKALINQLTHVSKAQCMQIQGIKEEEINNIILNSFTFELKNNIDYLAYKFKSGKEIYCKTLSISESLGVCGRVCHWYIVHHNLEFVGAITLNE